MNWRICPIIVVALAFGGCAHKSAEEKREDQEREAREEFHDDMKEARDENKGGGGGGIDADESQATWTFLGDQSIVSPADNITVMIDGDAARYSELRFKTTDSGLVLSNIVVTFADDTAYTRNSPLEFNDELRAAIVTLPGDPRVVRKIEFSCGNLGVGERATVSLFAR